MKKSFLHLCMATMLLLLVAVNTYAQSVGQTIKVDGVTYEYRGVTEGNRWVRIIAVDKTITGDVTFPTSIRNEQDTYDFAVKEIYYCSFGSGVTSVTLPEGVLAINQSAWGGGIMGTSIKVINIPASVETYDYSSNYPYSGIDYRTTGLTDINVNPANEHFCSVDGVLFSKDMKTLIRYPGGKTAESYTVPEGVEIIDNNGIVNSHLTSLNLASTTTTTKGAISLRCPNLTDISIPAAMTTLPALTECTKLENYWVADGNPKYSDIEGVLCNADRTTIVSYPLGRTAESYTIPSTIKKINYKAFYNSVLKTVDFEGSLVEVIAEEAFRSNAPKNKLTQVLNLPTTLRTIKESAFQSQPIASIVFPEGLETIGKRAFYSTGLTSVEFPETLKEIGIEAFDETKLTSVFLPAGVTELNSCFRAKTIERIDVSADNPVYSSIDGVVFSKDKTKLVEYPRGKKDAEYTIPEGTTVTGDNSFSKNTNLTKVNIPQSMVTIGRGTFQGCTSLSEVVFPENSQLKSISFYAFASCKLTEFNLPVSVEQLGPGAIENNPLTSFTVPDNSSLNTLAGNSLYNCRQLTDIYVGKNTNITSITMASGPVNLKKLTVAEGNTKLATLSDFNVMKNLETLTIAEDAGTEGRGIIITEKCFENMQKLTSVALPAGVVTLGKQAFSGCTNLTSVTIADTEENPCRLKEIGENVFYQCGIETFTVPSSVQKIAYEAFRECSALTTVDIPAGCTSVHFQAFETTPNLTAINVDKANTKYSSSDGIFLDKMKETLIIYPAGKAEEHFTLLPPSITKIGEMSFFNNPKLKSVMIPKHVTSIAVNAFNQCTNLKNIVLLGDTPADITIGKDAFLKVPTDATIWLRYDLQDKGVTEWNGFTNFDYCKMSADEEKKHQYEFFVMDDNTKSANVLSVKNNALDYTIVMPETVSDGTNTYKVDYLGDFMLEDALENVKEVVVKHTPKYVGANAFDSDFGHADAFFTCDIPSDDMSTIRFEYDKATFNGRYNEGQNLYMKKSVAERLKADATWVDMADAIQWQVPLPAISTNYGTFSREFAVDLDAINPDKENPNVIAFTAGAPLYDSSKNLTYVKMISINHTGETPKGYSGEGDGTYIPANTGVLLKAYKGTSTAFTKATTNAETGETTEASGDYYQIAETQADGYTGENLMASVTEHSRKIQSRETIDGKEYANFYVSKGQLWSVTTERTSTVHKSYLQLPSEVFPAGAKLLMVFGDDDTTGIDGVQAVDNSSDVIYNLQGQRVENAVKGIYIIKGKKVYVK